MKKLLVIEGPTGTGKTVLAVKLAKKFDGEIVSADSRQIYIGMDIGTGKVPENSEFKKEKGSWVVDGIPIHLYDVVTPDKTFSVAEYQQLAYKAINEIHKRDKLPILVGGTGLYIQAVTEGLKIPKVALDKKLRDRLEAQPLNTLFAELEKADPKTAGKIDKQNPRRVIRALEIFYQTGTALSSLQEKFKSNFDALQIGLTAEREPLYQKVDNRVDSWFEQGFIEEVKKLLNQGFSENLPAMSSLGYRQVAMFIQGKISGGEAKQRIKWETHSYIRRQYTWFRRNRNIFWFDINEKEIEKEIEKIISKWLTEKEPFVAG
jgi:tRNA dimethylallyltransferase